MSSARDCSARSSSSSRFVRPLHHCAGVHRQLGYRVSMMLNGCGSRKTPVIDSDPRTVFRTAPCLRQHPLVGTGRSYTLPNAPLRYAHLSKEAGIFYHVGESLCARCCKLLLILAIQITRLILISRLSSRYRSSSASTMSNQGDHPGVFDNASRPLGDAREEVRGLNAAVTSQEPPCDV